MLRFLRCGPSILELGLLGEFAFTPGTKAPTQVNSLAEETEKRHCLGRYDAALPSAGRT